MVTHAENTGFFTPGEMASNEIQQLTENGNAEPIVERLQGKTGVLDIVQGTTPLVPANDACKGQISHVTFSRNCKSF